MVIINYFHENPKDLDISPKVPFICSGISLYEYFIAGLLKLV